MRSAARILYCIVGRKKRFVKRCGNRVHPDEAEPLPAARFPDVEFACVGRDDCLSLFHDSRDQNPGRTAVDDLRGHLRFPSRAFQTRALEAIPKREAGKPLYTALEGLIEP